MLWFISIKTPNVVVYFVKDSKCCGLFRWRIQMLRFISLKTHNCMVYFVNNLLSFLPTQPYPPCQPRCGEWAPVRWKKFAIENWFMFFSWQAYWINVIWVGGRYRFLEELKDVLMYWYIFNIYVTRCGIIFIYLNILSLRIRLLATLKLKCKSYNDKYRNFQMW